MDLRRIRNAELLAGSLGARILFGAFIVGIGIISSAIIRQLINADWTDLCDTAVLALISIGIKIICWKLQKGYVRTTP